MISRSYICNEGDSSHAHQQFQGVKATLELKDPRARVFTELARHLTGATSAFLSVRWGDTDWIRGFTSISTNPAEVAIAQRGRLARRCNPCDQASVCITADAEGAAYLVITLGRDVLADAPGIQHQLAAVAEAIGREIALIEAERQKHDRLRFEHAVDNQTSLVSFNLSVKRLSNMMRLVDAISGRGTIFALQFRNLDRLRRAYDLGTVVVAKQLAAERIRSLLPPGSHVGAGPDEDSLLAFTYGRESQQSDKSELTPGKLGARMVDAVEALDVPGVGFQRFTPQVGISQYPQDAQQNADPGSLIARAEDALANARWNKSRVNLYDPQIVASTQQALKMEQRLQTALTERRLTVFYQAKVDAASEALVGAEALLRWKEEDLGSVSPGVFLPVAERLGLMPEIDNFVLEEACMAATRWGPTPNGNQPSIAVNIAPIHLQQSDFVTTINNILARTRLSPERLVLELTEDALPSEYASSATVMRELADIGVRFAIDDFGTGYSNLRHLQHLPFQSLKLDRTFVSDIGNEKRYDQLVESMITMAKALDLRVVAEGVETRFQASRLKAFRCHEFQGFLFARPVHESEFCQHFWPNQEICILD